LAIKPARPARVENENIFSNPTNKPININTCGKEMCKDFKAIRALTFWIFAQIEDKINLLPQEKFGSSIAPDFPAKTG